MSKITDSARDEDCLVRIPGVCNFDDATTIFAHLGGAGMALKSVVADEDGKPIDLGAYCCSACHDLLDARTGHPAYDKIDLKILHLEGMARTLEALIRKGLVKHG